MDKKSLEVVEHITSYFKEYLPKDTVLGVGRKSYHPDEAHLYTVLSKRENNGWGFCDCWDEKKKILIRGRYGIEFLDSFVRILNKNQGETTYYAVYSCTDKFNLPHYTVLTVSRKSLHPDDDHLYIVSAKNDRNNTYVVWSCWNERIQSLNHGNYGIKSLKACEELVKEYMDETKYFAVYRCSHNVKKRMFVTDSEEQARLFCEANNWEWQDENDFVWSLDYRET